MIIIFVNNCALNISLDNHIIAFNEIVVKHSVGSKSSNFETVLVKRIQEKQVKPIWEIFVIRYVLLVRNKHDVRATFCWHVSMEETNVRKLLDFNESFKSFIFSKLKNKALIPSMLLNILDNKLLVSKVVNYKWAVDTLLLERRGMSLCDIVICRNLPNKGVWNSGVNSCLIRFIVYLYDLKFIDNAVVRKISTLLEPHIMWSFVTIDGNIKTLCFQNLFIVFVDFEPNNMAIDEIAMATIIILASVVKELTLQQWVSSVIDLRILWQSIVKRRNLLIIFS